MPRIVVLGAGFAGLWAALGAARKREEIGTRAAALEILVIDRNPYHNIRVRNYEVDLSAAAIPLTKLLDPVCVTHCLAEVQAIDLALRRHAPGSTLLTEGATRQSRSSETCRTGQDTTPAELPLADQVIGHLVSPRVVVR